jgi:eukaryotic-like serine/threonine-protein kinase
MPLPLSAPPPDLTLQPPSVGVPGQLFAGRYLLGPVIGRGGMGTVYRARDLLIDEEVALKLLRSRDGDADLDIERIRAEVKLARRISHPNVVRTHDLNDTKGSYFITMELIDGCDLRAILDACAPLPLDLAQSVEILVGVCDGLTAAHVANVVHRDLKPANIILDRAGRAVVTDFGIACASAHPRTLGPQPSGLSGTPLYMAPEQILGGETSARTDIYALGLLLFEMCTGTRPIASENPAAIATTRLRDPPPDPRERARIPDLLAELILRCLSRGQEHRPATAADVAAALAPLRSGGRHQTLSTLVRSIATTVISVDATVIAPERVPESAPPRSGTVTRTLAVLPLSFHGPDKDAYLADALASELIDVLSRMHGLRVLSSSATEVLRSEHNLATLGRKLGADVLVEGTVQTSGERVRVFARLVEASSGVQLWAERFSGTLEDIFEFQDTMSQRIAEALRVSLGTTAYRGEAPSEAIELYLQARCRDFAFHRFGASGALELLERTLALAPSFAPAVAQHAIACLRTWFLPGKTPSLDLEALARMSVARAETLASDFAETHLARAMLSAQDNAYREAVVALTRALRIAPTCAPALQYLGQILCEAGRAEEGLGRLKLAYQLDPSLAVCLVDTARCNALRGDMDAYARALEQLNAHPSYRVPRLHLELRVASWGGDREKVAELSAQLADEENELAVHGRFYADAVLGRSDPAATIARAHGRLEQGRSSRFVSFLCQLSTEALCAAGRLDAALGYFQRAAGSVLIDLEWTERCAALLPLRTQPAFAEGRRLIRKRVEVIWSIDARP